jgi:hypothetical protein
MVISIILIALNIYLIYECLIFKNKVKKLEGELKIFINIANETQRKLREEANKNIILQSLINQKHQH